MSFPSPFTIQHKRGVKANAPALAAGEMYWCTDTFQLIVGTNGTLAGNKLVNTDPAQLVGYPGDATKFLNGAGGWTVPAGGGGGGGGSTPADLSSYSWCDSAGTLTASGVLPTGFTGSDPVNGYVQGAATNWVELVKAIAGGATTWSISACVDTYMLIDNAGTSVGLCCFNSSNNKRIDFWMYFISMPYSLYVQTRTGHGAGTTVGSAGLLPRVFTWFKASSNGTTMSFAVSPNGSKWFTLWTQSLATFVSPTHLGFMFNITGGGNTSMSAITNLTVTP